MSDLQGLSVAIAVQDDALAEQRRELYAKIREDLFKRQLSNAENFDKAILQYSSAGLAFSLAFLKDFAPVSQAHQGWLLYGSWGAFVLAIVATITSYVTSQKGIARQLELAEQYYLYAEESALNQKNLFAQATEWLNNAAGGCFIVAIVATTFFVALNIDTGSTMTNRRIIAQDGAPVPNLQRVQSADLKRGAPVPPLQKVPQQQQPQQQPGAPKTK